jgi:Helix-turn-helix domain
MEHIGGRLKEIEENIRINSSDPVARHGFTQVPNFILKNPMISVGAKMTYALFLSYAWHNNLCFPGQDRMAADLGLTQPRVAQFIAELKEAGLIEIERRGLGKTNIYTINFIVKKK